MRIPENPAPVLTAELLTGHFRRGPGYRGWREHGTRDWLLILTLAGQGRFGHPSGVEFGVQKGDLTLLRPGTRHDYGIAKGSSLWDILWTHFHPRPHWEDLLQWPEAAPGLMRIGIPDAIDQKRVEDRFIESHVLANGSLLSRDLFAMNALEEVLLWCASHVPREQPAWGDRRVQAVTEFVRSNLARQLGLDDLAEACGLSPSRLMQLFRRHVGSSPIRYLEEQRIRRAKLLLVRTSLSVAAIASEVGIENPYYFSYRFKIHTGLPPTQWRAAQART